MSAILMSETQRTNTQQQVVRSQTAEERFVEATGGYPLFGSVVGRHPHVIPGKMPDVALWLANQSATSLSDEELDRLLNVCADLHPKWFATATAVRLDRPSRTLSEGIHIFNITVNFCGIPDSLAPESAHDAYLQAIMDHPQRGFMYLEPLWRFSNGKRTPTTTADFKEMLAGQRVLLRSMARNIRFCKIVERIITPPIDAVVAVLSWLCIGILYVLSAIPVVRLVVRWLAYAKVRRLLHENGYGVSRSVRHMDFGEAMTTLWSPREVILLAELARSWDPIIAFAMPELKGNFGDEVPLALVAHWDDAP